MSKHENCLSLFTQGFNKTSFRLCQVSRQQICCCVLLGLFTILLAAAVGVVHLDKTFVEREYREVMFTNLQSESARTFPQEIENQQKEMRQDNERRIMILISNYRDSLRCSETLMSLFSNAVRPDLLRVGIFDQIYPEAGESTCTDAFCRSVGEVSCRRNQIRSKTIDASEATGPTGARYETEKFVETENFCLSIDSHLIFIKNWDTELLSQWDSIENRNAIITIYPKSAVYWNTTDAFVPWMCMSKLELLNEEPMIQYGAAILIPNPPKPRLMSQYAAGFNFGTCEQTRQVRSDPYALFLFHGEEYSRAARLWTNGFDFYSPSRDIVYHWYEPRHSIWERDWDKRYISQLKARRRIRYMLGFNVSSQDFVKTELGRFGMGNKRTVQQWINFTKIDLNTAADKPAGYEFNNCKELDYVPFAEHSELVRFNLENQH